MLKKSWWPLLLSAGLLAAAGTARSALLYSAGPTGALETPASVPASFDALAGAGALSLQLQGYATLDGDNFWIDILHVTLNGTEVFSGTFDLGGGGIDRVLLNPNNGSALKDSAAHAVDLLIPVTLLAGTNNLVISYESPTLFEGVARAGFQGLADEGWGLNSVQVSSVQVNNVPEPATAALMLGGLGCMGWLARRRRR